MRRPSIIHTQSPNYTRTLMYVNLSWTWRPLLNNLNDTCVSNVWLIRPEQTRNAREAEGWCTCKLKYMPLFTSFISVYRRVSCHLLRFLKHFFFILICTSVWNKRFSPTVSLVYFYFQVCLHVSLLPLNIAFMRQNAVGTWNSPCSLLHADVWQRICIFSYYL